jgi:hypothetical protein
MPVTVPASKAGTYAIVCFEIVYLETTAGGGHRQMGMEGTLTGTVPSQQQTTDCPSQRLRATFL